MTLVTPDVPSPGQEANASDISTPINQLADVINGDLDDTNISSLSGSKLAAGTVDTAQLTDGAATAEKLDIAAITLGYTQITSNVVKTSATPVLVDGLTLTVSAPGTRRVEVDFQCRDVFRSVGGPLDITLWDGPVGSGTQLQAVQPNSVSGSADIGKLTWISNTAPAAGSKTFNLAVASASGSVTIEAGATYPAFLVAKAI